MCFSTCQSSRTSTFSLWWGHPSLRNHLAVSNVPDKELPHLISGDCSGLAPLASVYKIHHRGSDDEVVVADQPAPQSLRRNAQDLDASIGGVFSRSLAYTHWLITHYSPRKAAALMSETRGDAGRFAKHDFQAVSGGVDTKPAPLGMRPVQYNYAQDA